MAKLLCGGFSMCPLRPFRGEREGPIAKRWEGEVGGKRYAFPRLTPARSALKGGEGVVWR